MMNSPAIWKTNPNNSWRLYRNSDYKLAETEPAPKTTNKDKKPQSHAKSQAYTPFTFTKAKAMTKGSVACTSQGYGIIQSFNEENNTTVVKIDGQAFELPSHEVSGEVPLNITFYNNSIKMEQVLYLPINSTMSEIIEKLENSFAEGDSYNSVSLFLHGKEMERSTETIEKLKLTPGTKVLALSALKTPLCIKRYGGLIYGGWSISSGNSLGLAFMTSKKIRIIGFSVYRPAQGTMTGTARLVAGTSAKGDSVWSKEFSYTETTNKEDFEKIMFNRPFVVEEGAYWSVILTFSSQFQGHYGNGGKQTLDGDGEVKFTFKTCDDMSHMNGYDAGQFPELFYYV